MKKAKLLSMLLCACYFIAILVFVTPARVQATNGSYPFLFRVTSNNQAIITVPNWDYSTIPDNLAVPPSIDGYPICGIDEHAFSGCDTLTSITIPDTITSIGAYAFMRCSNLKDIILSKSITQINDYTFHNCISLERIILPDGITRIGESAISCCSNIEEIVIPSSVTSIGTTAFYGDSNLKRITLPDGIVDIGPAVFMNCSSLESISLPKNITSITTCMFEGCESLKQITIPEGVTYIDWQAFAKCKSLESITFPDSITAFGEKPNGIGCTFEGCTNLKEVNLPSEITYIAGGMFAKCENLKHINIPGGITSIGKYAFDKCTNLETVYYEGTEDEWAAITIAEGNDNLINANIIFNHLTSIPSEPTVPSNNGMVQNDTAGSTVVILAFFITGTAIAGASGIFILKIKKK